MNQTPNQEATLIINHNPFSSAANPVVSIVNMFNSKRIDSGLSTYGIEVQITQDDIADHDELFLKYFEEQEDMISCIPFNLSVSDFQVFQQRKGKDILQTQPTDFLVVAKNFFTTSQSRLFVLYGSYKLIKEKEKILMSLIPVNTTIKLREVYLAKSDELVTTVRSIDAKDLAVAHPQFYPFEGFDKMLNSTEFVDAKENIAIMIGPPGTGKSTLLRHFIKQTYEQFDNIYLCNNPLIYTLPDFYTRLTSQAEGRNLIVLEDAAQALEKRDDGNVSMANLLNNVDGIVPSKDKLIISTNLGSLNTVDEAVYRVGRCFGVFKTELLTFQQANVVREKLGKTTIEDESTYKRCTLSEVIHYETRNRSTQINTLTGFQ